jgi:hypothetical protein
MTEMIRVQPKHLQNLSRDDGWRSSDERKYKHAYETPDGRWHIEWYYGGCGGGWLVTDTHGQYICSPCRERYERNGWRGFDGHAAILATLTAAKAFVSEWSA